MVVVFGETARVPLTARVPVHPPVEVHNVALVEDQLSVALPPAVMLVALTDKLAVGVVGVVGVVGWLGVPEDST